MDISLNAIKEDDIERDIHGKVKSEIIRWKPKKKSEVMLEANGQSLTIFFDKIFKSPNLKIYNNFLVKKVSFEPYLKKNTGYLNYFMNKVDVDGELPFAYLKLKFAIDKEKMFTRDNPEALIDLIYELIFTESMQKKIRSVVENNYLDDIDRPSDSYTDNDKYLESLEFTNEHVKILMRISFGMKLICPVMFHYFAVNKIKKPDELKSKMGVSIIYDFYFPLFAIFSDNVNMFNKLFVYIKRKVLDSRFHNEKIFKQHEIFGEDWITLIERFIKKQLISENMVKFQFNETWDPKRKRYKESPIGLQKTIIKYQIYYFLKQSHEKNLTEMTNTKGSDGLSAADKMEMNMTKLDIGMLNLSELNLKFSIADLESEIDVPVSEEEIQYYRDHFHPSDIQIQLIRSAYANYFMSYRDELAIDRHQFNKLLLLLKKKLLLEYGYAEDEYGPMTVLPYILTGNLEGKVNRRLIRDSNLMEELEEDPLYQKLVNGKYKELEELKPGFIKETISTFINTQFTYVCYEKPELTGTVINVSKRQVAHEILLFLNNI